MREGLRAGGAALLSLTRKALSDLADETLEDRIARHLGQRLENLAPDLRTAAGRAEEATITSHDDLPQSGRDDLTAKLKAVFPDVSVRFETDPDQSPGLVLRIGGAELDWTVGGYVDSLGDVLTARCVELNKGGRTGVYDIEVSNQRGERVAVFRGRSYTMKGKPVVAL